MQSAERTRFLILGMARSGTTVTHRALQGHPNVKSSMDEFRVAPFFTQGIAAFTVSGKNRFERDNAYDLLFDAVTMIPCSLRGPHLMGYGGTDEYPKGEILANGLKVAVSTVPEAEELVRSLTEFASFRDFAIILVERKDLVAQCASLTRAMRTGRWHSFFKTEGQVENPDAPFEIPEGQFDFYLQEAAAIHAAFDRLAGTHRTLTLSYEDEIAKLGPAAFRRVHSFLGLPEVLPTWLGSEKVAPPVESFLLNHERLHEMLAEFTQRTTGGAPHDSNRPRTPPSGS